MNPHRILLSSLTLFLIISCDQSGNRSSTPQENTPPENITASEDSSKSKPNPSNALQLEEYITSTIESDPFAVWYTLEQKHPEYLRTHPEIQTTLISKMAEVDVRDTLDLIANAKTPDLEAINQATRLHLAAKDLHIWSWHKRNRDALPPSVIDAVALAGARYNLEENDFGPAFGWLRRTINPRKHHKLRMEIYHKNLSFYRELATQDPEAFVIKIIQERGTNDDHWLDLGFEVWLAQSPDKALSWFEEHKSKLTIQQKNFINISFARSALKEGEITKAKKYARRLTDPKLKTKIHQEIAAAETAQNQEIPKQRNKNPSPTAPAR